MSIKKELTMKAAAEIFKLASRIGIKPRDIIGQGADIIKMGKSLFNTDVNPELIKFINTKGKIPKKLHEYIKVHIRSLKNASDNQIKLFQINLKEIVNAKPPVSGIKRPGASVGEEMTIVESQMGNIKKTSSKLDDAMKEYENIYKPKVKDEAAEAFKGWTPTIIKGGKDKLATGGMANLNAELNQLPEYYLSFADGGIANHFRKK